MSHVLPTHQITEAEVETYQIPEHDRPPAEDDIEMISSTSTADYDRQEVEASLVTIADAFLTIGQEYEKLVGVVPHMKKMQAATVIARIPIPPFIKEETKAEGKQALDQLPPRTSQDQGTIQGQPTEASTPAEVLEEEIPEKEEEEPEAEITNEYFRKYMLTGKGKGPKEKINEVCKEINYKNMLVLIAVGDYIINKPGNIKGVAQKWGLSFSSIQRAMFGKKKHSVGGRQYAKRKRSYEEKEGTLRKSKHLKGKVPSTTVMAPKDKRSAPEVDPDEEPVEMSSGEELPDVP